MNTTATKILAHLTTHDTATFNDLYHHTQHPASDVSTAIDHLEQLGTITRMTGRGRDQDTWTLTIDTADPKTPAAFITWGPAGHQRTQLGVRNPDGKWTTVDTFTIDQGLVDHVRPLLLLDPSDDLHAAWLARQLVRADGRDPSGLSAYAFREDVATCRVALATMLEQANPEEPVGVRRLCDPPVEGEDPVEERRIGDPLPAGEEPIEEPTLVEAARQLSEEHLAGVARGGAGLRAKLDTMRDAPLERPGMAEALDRAAWAVVRAGAGLEPEPRELLTAAEHAAITQARDLMGALSAIAEDGPARRGDLAEVAAHIHGIQRAVLKNAAARAYPDLYRVLGGWPAGGVESTHTSNDQEH